MPADQRTLDKLAQEAIEKEVGKQRPTPAQQLASVDQRLAQAAAMLEAAMRTMSLAMNHFMESYKAGIDKASSQSAGPSGPTDAAVNRMREAVRPKTFNQNTESQE